MNTVESTIQVRTPSFAVEAGAGGLWNPRRPELSHTLNAFQLALPYLEPYFIDAIRQAADHIEQPKLKADALAFCAQEANHSRQHMRYCRLLRQRYPRLKEYETEIQQSLVASRQRDPLEWRLAYTAGYEAITAQLARTLFSNAEEWFRDADPSFAALMTWHAAEEIEHRHVAFEVLNAVTRDYRLRARGLLAAMRKTYADMMPVVTYMLEVDGCAERFDVKARRLRLRAKLAADLVPALCRYLTPSYHPSRDREPALFNAWLSDYARSSSEAANAGEASASS